MVELLEKPGWPFIRANHMQASCGMDIQIELAPLEFRQEVQNKLNSAPN